MKQTNSNEKSGKANEMEKDVKKALEQLRDEIDDIDRQIVSLLAKTTNSGRERLLA
jgi:hypothetical protein